MDVTTTESTLNDKLAETLRRAAQTILVVVFGLLPLFFIPISALPFEYTKILFVFGGMLFAFILFSLSVLRSGTFRLGVSTTFYALWGVVGIALVSALLSSDFRDAFIGDTFSIHSVAFLGVMALSISSWLLMGTDKMSIMRLYILLSVSTLVLALFHVVRLIFGADALSFGIFTDTVASPIGRWNDLALFLGLAVLLSLVALEQLPLTRVGRTLFAVVTSVSLVMLAIINFFSVWIVLGLVSLVLLVYMLGRDRFNEVRAAVATGREGISAVTMSLMVFVVSVLFIISGSALSGFINTHTGITHIEVRPSLQATADIAQSVYHDDAFLGIGPNRFADAWRLFKDPSINNTAFWNTDFNSGVGYIPTLFVTTGVLGALVILLFLFLFVANGVRSLVQTPGIDRMWYFIGLSSFVGASYIWLMALIYVPGATVLLIGALCTGVTLVAQRALSGQESGVITFGRNKRSGFILTLAVIVVIIGSVSLLYTTGRHYVAAYTFNKSFELISQNASIDAVEAETTSAYALSESDTYMRQLASYQLLRVSSLLGITEPTEIDQQAFQKAIQAGIVASQKAVALDATDPENWFALGNVYGVLASARIDGAYDQARVALARARDFDPQNPARSLALAQLEAQTGNIDGARELAREAIQKKSDYSDAYFFLTQIEIATGNTDAALQSARSAAAVDAGNPARQYQLGVLEASAGYTDAAIAAFERAVVLDTNYANARYFLALAYEEKGRTEEARTQLERVLELNPGNTTVQTLLTSLGSGRTPTSADASVSGAPTQPNEGVSEDDTGTVTAIDVPDSALITPVNTVPEETN